MQQHTNHHDAAVYDNAWSYDPVRWLKTNGGTAAMKESYMPWGRGSRACMGSHLATMELKLVISAVVHGWTLTAAPGTDDKCMSMIDHFGTYSLSFSLRLLPVNVLLPPELLAAAWRRGARGGEGK